MSEAAAEAGSGGSSTAGSAVPLGSPAVVASAAARGAESPTGGGAVVAAPMRIAAKKGQLRSAPRAKKLEKLGVYSACKADETCKCNGWKNPNPPPTPPRMDLQQTVVSLTELCRSCSHTLGCRNTLYYGVETDVNHCQPQQFK